MKFYKIKTGYARDEFLSIPETELAKAVYAHVHGTVFVHSMGTLSGKLIQRIDPDYHRQLNFNFEYELKGEDFRELPAGFREEALLAINVATQKAIAASPGARENGTRISQGERKELGTGQ